MPKCAAKEMNTFSRPRIRQRHALQTARVLRKAGNVDAGGTHPDWRDRDHLQRQSVSAQQRRDDDHRKFGVDSGSHHRASSAIARLRLVRGHRRRTHAIRRRHGQIPRNRVTYCVTAKSGSRCWLLQLYIRLWRTSFTGVRSGPSRSLHGHDA